MISSLGTKGVIKLFAGMEAEDMKVRKASAKLVCDLAFQNEKAQLALCDLFAFIPLQGKVCLNSVPGKLQRLLKSSPHLLSALKKSDMPQAKYWCFPPIDSETYKKSLTDIAMFPDPKDFMIGFYVGNAGRAAFIDTTTSYISEASVQSRGASLNASKEDPKSRNSSVESSPIRFSSIPEATSSLIRRQLRPIVPTIRTSIPSRGSSNDSSSRGSSPSQIVGRFKSIEDSLQRIRAALDHKVDWPGSKTERQPRVSAMEAVTEAFRNKRKEKRKSSPDTGDSGRFKHSEEAVMEIIRMKRKQIVKQAAERNQKPPLTPPRTVSPFNREQVASRPPFRV